MAMGPEKGQQATMQVELMVCLDELVPADDPYRRLDRLIDWSFVRVQAAPYYADEGRPSVDPIVLVKLMLAGALEGIGSMRELLRVAAVRLDLRRFLGYGLTERLPVHQTLSHAQTRRFVDAALFERIFTRTVALCGEHDLLDGTHLSIDGFHTEANAALASLRASLASAPEPPADDPRAPAGDCLQPAPAQLELCEPPVRGAQPPTRRSSNATTRSRSDPDARLRHKPGQRPHLVYRGQVAVDPRARCVIACLGEPATGHEGDAVAPLLDRVRFVLPGLVSVGADCGFAAERVYADLERRGLAGYIPPQPNMLGRGALPATTSQRLARRARGRCKTSEGVWAHARRMADAEGVISELKTQGTLARARCRGRSLFHVQVLVDCAALNCKRLIERAAGRAEGIAGAGQAAASAPTPPLPALTRPAKASAPVGAFALSAATLPTWTFLVSLN